MGLIQEAINEFEDSLQKTIGEVPVLLTNIPQNKGRVITWYEGIEGDGFYELNHGSAPTFLESKISLIESLTSDYNTTYSYCNGSGVYIHFFWNGKGFERE